VTIRSVAHKQSKGALRGAPFLRVANYGGYLANWLSRLDKGSGSNLRQSLLLLLLSFGEWLKAADQRAGKRRRARWPDEMDREVRSRLPEEWRNRVLDALLVGTAGPHPPPGTGTMLARKGQHSVRDFPGGAKEWRVKFMVRFVPPAPEGSRIHVTWWASDELSGVIAAAATLVQARALHLVRPCSNCKRFFFARRADAVFCNDKCRVTHWKQTPKGRDKHAAYMRQYRQNPLVRRRSGPLTRNKGARAASTVRNLGNSLKRGK